jgi:hypothetical protein
VEDLINKLKSLTGYSEQEQMNTSKMLVSMSITERLNKLITLYAKSNNTNSIVLYNFLGILSFLCLYENLALFYQYLTSYIEEILNNDNNKYILLMFLYKLINSNVNKNSNTNKISNTFFNRSKYQDMTKNKAIFLIRYKEILEKSNKSFFTKNKINSISSENSNIKIFNDVTNQKTFNNSLVEFREKENKNEKNRIQKEQNKKISNQKEINNKKEMIEKREKKLFDDGKKYWYQKFCRYEKCKKDNPITYFARCTNPKKNVDSIKYINQYKKNYSVTECNFTDPNQ